MDKTRCGLHARRFVIAGRRFVVGHWVTCIRATKINIMLLFAGVDDESGELRVRTGLL